ncbi:type II toxin-antitoxin system VapC family toxin [Sandaracinobacter neustonicus]|uniref:Ribonuclease VapC n=1 Tax=Sandaracinobacter neustonicus TaxID=1715348 RepID=A0A501XII2_9SPHN|nr:type II toxin-antitoxin system VapC family toxin [Sandaracinobacter neustonicus]TPE60468.1 type II toxin-antitoxin system VapC family toxin [Sandaracinobacter neustonicus]
MTELPKFLLDSNICIYWLGGVQSVLERVMARADEIAVSSISYGEVAMGLIPGSAQWEAGQRFFRLVPVLPFDRAAADSYARLPFRRARFDRLIAAHALALGARLVTNDRRGFADVPGLDVEEWRP